MSKKMKQIILLFTLALIFFDIISPRDTHAQTPTYNLIITNDLQVDDKNYEFDIFLVKTGVNTFEYANNSQFFININPAIKNGGSLSFTILPGTCQLNAIQQIQAAKVTFDNVNNRLRIAAHSPSGAGTGTIISNVAPGVRLGRFRVTNTVSFTATQAGLNWYNGPSGFFTKVFAYVAGNNVEITDAASHLIIIVDPVLPVTLADFNYSATRNNIKLFWTTTQEINNSGFQVERMNVSSNIWESAGNVQGHGTTNEMQHYAYEDLKLPAAKYKYRLKQTDFNGNFEYFNLASEVDITKPNSFSISQNYPNPSNPKSKIDYELPLDGMVTIKVYDLIGREVATLVNETKQAGYYTSEFDGTNISSGIYFYVIKTASFTGTKKMVLVK